MKPFRFGLAAIAAFALVVPVSPAVAQLTEKELKCSASVAKNFAKLQGSIVKIKAKCHADDISGKNDSANACEEPLAAEVQEKIGKAQEKFVSSVAKSCKSVCAISDDVSCVADIGCPARHQAMPANNGQAERCLGKGGSAPFSIFNLDWPGPYCESILGHTMRAPEDMGTCLALLVDTTADAIDEAVYASLSEASSLSDEAQKCASGIAKAVPRAAGRAYTATAACRDARRAAFNSTFPFAAPAYQCATEDADTVDSIQGELDKMSASIDKSCEDADIAALTGLCGAGGTPPTTVAQAQSCLSELVRELATQERAGHRHVYAPLGMLNVTHPGSATAFCGDGVVTATREEHTGVGEECDGAADAACPGNCLPAGDVFECTCATTPRERFIVDGDGTGTDSDAGWIGSSHDATHNDGFGYVTELSGCNCTDVTGAECTGSTSDAECTVFGNMAPRCSDDPGGTDTCDDRGNGNTLNEDRDCLVCDSYSINADTWCGSGTAGSQFADQTVCQSQCIVDATGLPTMPVTACQNQDGCAEGQTCRGRCDPTITCTAMTEGSPLPLISAATPVCVNLEYKTDIVGTKDIVSGAQTVEYETRSKITLGILFARPCPVCTGLCVGGAADSEPCFGRCDISNDTCLVDEDCPGPGDSCLEANDDCAGGSCSLDLRCSGGANAGRLCRVDSVTPLGVVSHECPPGEEVSGIGVQQNFGDVTTGTVQFPTPTPCSDPTWANFDCPCPADDPPTFGFPTRPNNCAAACNAGVNIGKGCVTGGGGSGTYTVCNGGAEDGLPCDVDADCPLPGLCNDQVKHCTAGTPGLIGTSCTIDANCGGGGLCGDPCPGGLCVPLCSAEGRCTGGGGAREGDVCSTTDHCKQCTVGNALRIGQPCDINASCNTLSGSGDGVCAALPGVTCAPFDAEDGLCAGGPWKSRCNGAGYTSVPCSLEYGLCTSGLCDKGSASLHNTACAVNTDCVENENVPVSSGCETGVDSIPGTADDIPGAGECEPVPEDCFLNNGMATGGGTPSQPQVNAAFCTPPNSNPGINSVSGFGGPSRIRRTGTAHINIDSFTVP